MRYRTCCCNMKDRYFLIVLCAVFCTVWSEAESQDCNVIEETKECLDHFPVPTDDGKSLFFTSREELDRWCRDVNRGLRCLDSYARRGMTEKYRHHFYSKFKRTKQLMKKRCVPGPHQEEFLLHAPCLAQLSDDYEHFLHQYMQKIVEFQAKLEDPDRRLANEIYAGTDNPMRTDSPIRTVCCLFRYYVDGLQWIMMEKCGEKTAKYIEDVLIQIYDPQIQDMCKSYLHGSDQCQGSSANRNFQRVLLLPISLAMLSLYALRYT